MTADLESRRRFLASLSAIAAATPSLSAALSVTTNAGPSAATVRRGLAPSPGDFLFSPGLVYLQTGSLGPSPRPVIERTIAAWKELELNPVYYGYGPHEHAMDDVRAKAAAFIGCQTKELVLTNCTTEGMNWVAQGLSLETGDHVLTTDQEHPGGRVCWDYVARKNGVVLDIVTIPPGQNDAQAIIDQFAQRITPRTRVLSFSHLLSSTGLRMPVAELSALARSRGCISVVDGAQATGGIDVNVKALGCHVYATSGHKWMLGPKGTGLLYLSDDLGTAVDPISLQDGRAAYSASSGVGNIPGVLGLAAAMDYLLAIGKADIERHNLALSSRVYAALQGVPKIQVVSAPPGPLASPLVTFKLPDDIPSRVFQERLMAKHNVVVKVVPANWFNGNRISTHLFNSEQDVDALIAALRMELR